MLGLGFKKIAVNTINQIHKPFLQKTFTMPWKSYDRDNPPEWEDERDDFDTDWEEKWINNKIDKSKTAAEHEKIIQLRLWEAVASINAAREEYNAMVNKGLMIINNRDFVKAYLEVDEALTNFSIPDVIKNKL